MGDIFPSFFRSFFSFLILYSPLFIAQPLQPFFHSPFASFCLLSLSSPHPLFTFLLPQTHNSVSLYSSLGLVMSTLSFSIHNTCQISQKVEFSSHIFLPLRECVISCLSFFLLCVDKIFHWRGKKNNTEITTKCFK